MKIGFKNGKEIEVVDKLANTLKDEINNGKVDGFFCYKYDGDKIGVVLNISEITYIR